MKKNILLLLSLMFCFQVFAQKLEVKGHVVDEQGESLPYLTISVKGTTTGSVTDDDGNFTINVNKNQSLVFQFVGYKTKEIRIGNNKFLKVVMESNISALDEVVVVGYGKQKKESVVGAISQTKGSDILKSGGVNNVSRSLSGLMAGVVTINQTGAPGEDVANIFIRGRSTWNDSSPLYLVDGIEQDINTIDPHEIETLSVLKDASATAVFGVRGGNGVILITTKRGSDNKPRLRFGINTTLKTASELPSFERSYTNNWLKNQSRELLVPIKENVWESYVSPWELELYKDQSDPMKYPDVDWKSLTLKDYVWQTNYNFDVQGGSNKLKYFASLSYIKDNDLLNVQDLKMEFGKPHNDYGRFNFRSNIDYQITNTTKFSVDLSGNRAIKRRSDLAGNNGGNIWSGIYGKASDLHPLVYEDGIYGFGGDKDPGGGNAFATMGRGLKTYTTTEVVTTFRFEQKLDFLIKNLVFNAVVSRKYNYQAQKNIDATDVALKYVDPVTGQVTKKYPWWFNNTAQSWDFYAQKATAKALSMGGVNTNLMYQTSLNYHRKFGKNNVTALANFKRNENSNGGGFPSYREEWAGRVTYDYDSKYLFETNVAYNGSEKFDRGSMFGFFPSFAVGWVISNEKFFKDNIKFINFLKVRYSSGKVGSDSSIGRWLYQTNWGTSGKYSGGYSGISANNYRFGCKKLQTSQYSMYKEGTIANPNATWETAVKNDVAIETRVLDSRLRFSLDYYWNTRKNIFSSQGVPPWYGAAAQKSNLGQTEDSGVEIELNYNGSVNKDFNYAIGFNAAYAKNKVIKSGDPELRSKNLKGEGYAIGQIKSILNDRIMNSWDEVYLYPASSQDNSTRLPGLWGQVDYNGDGFISGEDVVPAGFSSNPEWMYGLNLSASYKRLNVSLNFSGMQNISYSQEYPLWGGGAGYSYAANSNDFLDVWLPGRENSASKHLPIALNVIGADNGNQNIVDGTTWRLKSMEISYNIPIKGTKTNIRLYATGNNLFIWNHVDMDMERSAFGNYDNLGFGRYPMTKTFSFGTDISF